MENPHNEINARLPWLDGEITYLTEQYKEGQSVTNIAKALGRSYDAVSSRVGVLRLRRECPKHGRRFIKSASSE